MAKDEINRATRAEAGDVVGAPKQQDVAQLLKKMKVVADADSKAAAHVADDQVATTSEKADAQAQADASQMVASADSIFASDAAPVEVAMLDGGAIAGAGGGVGTGTLLAIGGVALVGGGIAVAANNDSGGNGGTSVVATSVTAAATSVNEGQSVNFNVTGTPGAVLSWSVDSAHGSDVTAQAGSVTLDSNGHGVITITTVADSTTEGSETLTLTVDSATATVTIADTSTTPAAANADLTTGTDGAPTFDFTGTTGANVVGGVAAGGNPNFETFSVGDHVIGNGETVLELKVADGGSEAVASLEHLGEINLINAAGATNASFEAVLWHDVGSINLVDGADGLRAFFDNLETGVDMTVASGVAGAVSAALTNDVYVGLSAGKTSDISWVGNVVDANVGDNESARFEMSYDAAHAQDVTLGTVTVVGGDNASFSLSVSDTGAGTGDVTVGDVSITMGDTASVTAYVYGENGAGDITVGDIDISGGSDSEVSITVEGYGSSAGQERNITVGNVTVALGDSSYLDVSLTNSGYSTVGDLTVGDVSLSVGDGSGTGYFYAQNTAYNSGAKDDVSVGDLTVGDVSMTGGTDAYLYANVSQSASAQTGDATAGNVAVGDVSMSVGDSGTAYLYVTNEASTNKGGATVGDLTVGDVTLSGGVDAYVYANIFERLDANVSGSGAAGDMTVGDVSVSLAQGATGYVYLSDAYYGKGDGAIGDVSVGNISLDVATSASVTAQLYLRVDTTGASNSSSSIGNVTVGDLTADVAVNAEATFYFTVDASAVGTGVGTIGNVTVGNINATLNDGATFTYDASIYAENTGSSIGDVSFGDITVAGANGVSSSASITIDVSASYGDVSSFTVGDISAALGVNGDVSIEMTVSGANVGDVTIGNVSGDAMLTNADFYGSLYAYGYSGDVGAVSIGDVSMSAGVDATAEFEVFVYATKNIGDITVGDVSVTADGSNAYASFYMDVSSDTGAGLRDIGAITLGNLAVDVAGPGAQGYVFISASDANNIGALTVGDVSLSLDANSKAAVAETAALTVDLLNTVGDVVVGDISFDVGSAQGTNPVVDSNNFYFSVSAGGDVTLGVISVTGGDAVQDNIGAGHFDDFANVMSNVTAGGDITIGGVDYSGYGADATINVSAFKGAATIVGSANNDVITDNSGTNTVTGGAGADTFKFVDTNTGLTAAAADKITDFVYGTDHIDLTPAINVGNYTEGTYADFAAFLAGADAADKAVAAGQVGANVFLAVDYNTDGAVDYVVELVNSNLANVAVDSFV